MKFQTLVFAAALAASFAARAEFSLDVDAPDVRVVVPSLPQVKMDPHPAHAEHANLRLIGVEGNYMLTLNTPDADAGMKPQQCADIIASALTKRPGVPPQENIIKTKLDANTFAAMYVVPKKAGQMQLNAHLISAGAGTHCVEFHVAKVTSSREEVQAWVQTFAGARIEPKK
jgi:hypothetical protein